VSRRSEQGLTLVELLVALAIAAIVLLSVQGVFLSASTLREKCREEGVVYHRSRVLFDRLEREMGSTLFRTGLSNGGFVMSNGNEPSLEFSTFASSPGTGGHDTGAAVVRYSWRASGEVPGLELWRRERPLQGSDEEGFEQSMATGIEDVTLRCFDGERWLDAWDSHQSQRVPKLLEVTYDVVTGEHRTPFRSVLEISAGSGS